MNKRLEKMFAECKARHTKEIVDEKPVIITTEEKQKLNRANKLAYTYHWHDINTYNFDCEADFDGEWVVDNAFTECIYCGETDWHKLGFDRINNNKPHTKDNVVPCCTRCNKLRSNKFTIDEMKEIGAVIRRIENRHKIYFKRQGKKVASFDDEDNIVKEYPCAAQTQEDGYSARIVRRACLSGERYKEYYWKYV